MKNYSRIVMAIIGLVLVMPAAQALEKGDWILDIRPATVSPNDDSSLIFLDGAPLDGTGVKLNSDQTLDISLAYMFTDNWAVQVLADVSSEHDARAFGLGAVGVPDGTKVLSSRVLPPTVFMQYQFNPKGKVRPFAGLGLNYTMFISDDLTDAAVSVLGASDLDMDSSVGLAGQFGIDFDIGREWFLSVDAKYIDIDTEASFNTSLGRVNVDVDIDPWVFAVGFGKAF